MSQELKAVGDDDRQMFSSGDTVADRFDIEELIDEGPFGEVYRARDTVIETDVALKIFEQEVVEGPPQREEFLAATRSARAMTQKNVVRIHDSGVYEDYPWVSMQYLEGLTLEKTLKLREKKDERFTVEELEPVVTQITLALQHIGREFPNGDLKPTNIFFLPDLLKVTDGYMLAALPGEVFAERLEDSKYLAPELHTSTEEADVRCDVYSLGMIIGEMIFGPDYTPGTDEIDDPELSAVDALCRRATAFDPAERYPTVEALSEDFATLVDTGQLLERGAAMTVGEGPDNPPAPPPGGSPDSIDAEAPEERPGFGEFPEDEIATEDYERSHQSGRADEELPPTNEVERSEYPPPPESEAPEAEPADTSVEPAPEPESTESSEPEQPTVEHEPADEARATSPPGASEEEDDEDSPVMFIAAGLAVVAALALGIFTLTGSEESGDEVVDISDESKQAESAETTDEENTDGTDQEDQKGPSDEKVAAAIDKGTAELASAFDAAVEKAQTKAKALAEKKKEQEKEKEQAERAAAGRETGAGSSPRDDKGADDGAAGSEGSRSSDDSKSAGTATGRSGGQQEQTEEPEQGTDCPSGMALVERDDGNFCIDRFEYPGRNKTPMNNATWFEAKSECRSEGKRLCKLREWRRACGAKYPYGSEWDPSKCNTQDKTGFPRSLAPSGKFDECRSWAGAYDMVGNVLEWVQEQKVVGGGFGGGPEVASCRYASSKSPGSASRSVGFRCCADPK
jgi:serine/threonine protein kinase